MILNDKDIRKRQEENTLIHPFLEEKVYDPGVLSYGPEPAGYTIRLKPHFKMLTRRRIWLGKLRAWMQFKRFVLDPKDVDSRLFEDIHADYIDIPPHGFALAVSLEWTGIPDDVLALLAGKSTYARCTICLNTTVMEPGWNGHITIEISNLSGVPVRVYANEGIGQLIFFEARGKAEVPYDAHGRYNNQRPEPTLARSQ